MYLPIYEKTLDIDDMCGISPRTAGATAYGIQP